MNRRCLTRQYRPPRYRIGDVVTDAIRGDVVVTRTSEAPTPWPMGKLPGGRKPGLVVFAGLLEALRTESAVAICHHWGVTPQTVSKWRGLLDIDQKTAGARRLRQKRLTPVLNKARHLIDYKASERCQRIAAGHSGKPRPQYVIEAVRKATAGRVLTEEHKQKIGSALRQRGVRPPKAGRAWTADEDHAVRTMSGKDAALATGRTLRAVYSRRQDLGISDGRTTRHRKHSD